MDMGLALIRRSATEGSTLTGWKDFITGRDTEMETVLEPGNYIVVPRTTGCSLKSPSGPEAEEEPLLSLFDENQ